MRRGCAIGYPMGNVYLEPVAGLDRPRMPEPITRRRAATQSRLLDAALAVFADRGVLGGTVEEICDRAGFTRGAFYSNFDSKDDLVLALFNRSAEENTDGLASLLEEEAADLFDGERMAILEAAVRHFVNFQRTDRHYILLQAEIRLYAIREPSIRRHYMEYRNAFHAAMARTFLMAQRAYGLTYSMPMEPAVASIDAVYESCLLDALTSQEGHELDDLRDLPPDDLMRYLEPLMAFLDAWITSIDPPADIAARLRR